ncbi:MAG: hypothetical protein OEU78_02970 [Gammaproteobacteria bacterium]|nr:hypothetical protein [Gammaproteobacteria bacterium]MDH3887443.1 hypothetical protein [Gammaproteobacteria bacterium]MDH3934105.1 hypothetical protein [Gammaproteobacteria bacterium]
MYTDIGKLLQDMRGIQEQLEQFFEETREKFRYTLEDGRVRVSTEVRQLQRRYRVSSFRYLLDADWRSVVTAPVIYSMIVPLVIIDISFTLYQHICFRAYGVPRVSRRNYLVNDRHLLVYLNTIEKINCTYCGYGNGVLAYTREIISRTEQYWCPIRHAHRVIDSHRRYPQFFAYGDAKSYQQGLKEKRNALVEGRYDEEA